jgi:hypothetical protein
MNNNQTKRGSWWQSIPAAFVLLVCLLFNLGGDYVPSKQKVIFGWPWVYSRVYLHEFGYQLFQDKWYFWFRPYLADKWNWPVLLGNVLVAILIACVVHYLWKWRCRRVNYWYQITVLDWFAFCLLFACGYGWYRNLYYERELKIALDNLGEKNNIAVRQDYWGMYDESDHIDILDVMLSIDFTSQDIPADWFWEQFPKNLIPYPYVNTSLYVESRNNELQPLPIELVELLQKFRHLETLETKLENRMIAAESFPLLEKLPRLTDLHLINSQPVNDASPGTSTRLRTLSVIQAPDFTGSQLLAMPELETLSLHDTGLSEQGFQNICQLQKLDSLSLIGNRSFKGRGVCEQLRQLPNLRRLILSDAEIDDWSELQQLSQLPQLTKVMIMLSDISDSRLKQVAELRLPGELWIMASNLRVRKHTVQKPLSLEELREHFEREKPRVEFGNYYTEFPANSLWFLLSLTSRE